MTFPVIRHGIYGFVEISDAGAAAEDAVIAELGKPGTGEETDRALDGVDLPCRELRELRRPDGAVCIIAAVDL
jgi:hypothetical protein